MLQEIKSSLIVDCDLDIGRRKSIPNMEILTKRFGRLLTCLVRLGIENLTLFWSSANHVRVRRHTFPDLPAGYERRWRKGVELSAGPS